MMAFIAARSLKHTIEHLRKSSHISLVPSSESIIESACLEVDSFEEVGDGVNALDVQIRDTVSKFEDALESVVSNQILVQSNGETHPLFFSIDLLDLKEEVHCLVETLKKMEEYVKEFDKKEEDDVVSTTVDEFAEQKSKIVGSSDQVKILKDSLLTIDWNNYEDVEVQVIALVGMAGIGKTTLAREVFEDPDTLSHFDCQVWVSLCTECLLKDIPRLILAQVNPDMEGHADVVRSLKVSLGGRRFLIVLDNVWDTRIYVFDLRNFLPEDENGSRVLLTTRRQKLAKQVNCYITMRQLNNEESWDLLREKVFVEELCPSQLEKAGKKIAEYCDGLPLTIVTIADLLSKTEKTLEYWNEIAAKKKHQIFVDAYEKISEVLYPSYQCLNQYIKIFFLRMGVFPQNFVIPRSKLMNMWSIEEFLDPCSPNTPEVTSELYLKEVVSDNLALCRMGTPYFMGHPKICTLHSSFWYLCKREAEKINFFYVLDNLKDGLSEGIRGQRRLCIHNNVLLGIKDVHNSMEDYCETTARSLLCFGVYNQYQVPICSGLRLLRELDALTIRFYEFPMEILNLVLLRYVALTCNAEVPPSISKLWDLRFLIVRRYLSVKSCEAPLYLPEEIWDMKELKHIQIEGSDLPTNACGTSLHNLSTLLDVSIHSCNEEVFGRIPNLKKLGIQIELAPDDEDRISLGFLSYISSLRELKSLKCVVVNPEFAPLPAPVSMFPSSLKKLHLSGLGYPWKYMSIIATLPYLGVLKLRNYAFRGPEWETKEGEFEDLSFLLIEDTDLVKWKVGHGSFKNLFDLSMKHCYKLKEIQGQFGKYLKSTEAIHCGSSLDETYLQQLKP